MSDIPPESEAAPPFVEASRGSAPRVGTAPPMIVVSALPETEGSDSGIGMLAIRETFGNETSGSASTIWALPFREDKQVALLRERATVRIANGTSSPFQVYSAQDRSLMEREFAEVSFDEGDRIQYLMKRGFSTLTQPPDWRAENAKWKNHLNKAMSPANARALIQARERRVRNFRQFRNAGGVLRVILPESSICDLLLKGEYARDDPAQIQGHRASQTEVDQYLDHFLTFVGSDTGLELALAIGEQERSVSDNFWLIRDRKTVIIEVWRKNVPRGGEDHFGVSISGEDFVDVFRQEFNKLWNAIPLKDPAKVREHILGLRDKHHRTDQPSDPCLGD